MDLTNEDVADILALLDSLPYDELDLETPRFRLTLRRTPAGWTQSAQVHTAPPGAAAAGTMEHQAGYSRHDGASSRPGEGADGAGEVDVADGDTGEGGGGGERGEDRERAEGGRVEELVAVRAPRVWRALRVWRAARRRA